MPLFNQTVPALRWSSSLGSKGFILWKKKKDNTDSDIQHQVRISEEGKKKPSLRKQSVKLNTWRNLMVHLQNCMAKSLYGLELRGMSPIFSVFSFVFQPAYCTSAMFNHHMTNFSMTEKWLCNFPLTGQVGLNMSVQRVTHRINTADHWSCSVPLKECYKI